MSYLNLPRLIFSGNFQADVSTVNNDPAHFDTGNFQPNYGLPSGPDGFAGTPPNPGHQDGWWNPRGTGAWRFFNCFVTSVVYRDGTVSDGSSPNPDPVVGLPLNAVAQRVEGKLVDLDPEQQMVSEIWGFRILVGDPRTGLGVGGDFRPAAFADIWTRFPGGQPDSFFGAIYQSVLENVVSANQGASRFLSELLEGTPDTLSVKFNVDGMDDDPTSNMFTFGRVVGAIGNYRQGEPKHFVPSRQLLSAPNLTFGTAYAKIDGSNLILDLGNTIPTTSAGGPLAPQGNLSVALQNGIAFDPIGPVPSFVYEQSAGIVSIPLTSAFITQSGTLSMAVVNATNTAIVSDGGANPQTTAPAQFVRADNYVFRFNPGDPDSGSHTVDFYATSFGKPASGQTISLALDSSLAQGFVNQGVPISGPPVGIPTNALSWPSSPIVTDANGKASVVITSSDPGNPRGYVDGQVYGITYGLGATPPATGSVQNPSQILNPLVFSAYEIPEQPNWTEHAGPILRQYANLYPIMRPIVDLSNYASVISKIGALKRVFGAKPTDPNYMPVTRDLSAPKRAMLLKWLDRPLYMNLDSVEDVRLALQTAIELEHATIPTYLTALYSIKPGYNTEAANLIRSVVIEEMLHMHLACNILISIGGSPQIGQPGFMPTYPSSLPGGLRKDLTVRLRRCSIEHIRECFLSIEEPETTAAPVRGAIKPGDKIDPSLFTIGWFYEEILYSLEQLGSQVTYGNRDKQVVDGRAFPILSLHDAKRAIREVIRQGEGASPFNPDAGPELSHFFKFSEIVNGRSIVITKEGFAFSGTLVPFDPEGVYPMMDDPDLALYPTGSRAQILGMQFAQTYQALLDCMQTAFNGSPEKIGDAKSLMFSLALAARQLMETPSGLKAGTTAGPCFQLPIPGLIP